MANRFQISVPKRRSDDDPWFRIGSLDVTTTVLVIGLNVVVMFLYAVSNTFFYKLAMLRSFVTDGQIWRLVTWPFVTVPDIWAALGLAFFWFVGRQLEQQFGRVRFTKFLATIAIVVLALALLTDTPLVGMRLLVLAAFVTFVAENPRMPFFFGIPAWVLAAVYVGLDIIRYTGDKQPKLILLLLAAIGTALLLLRAYGWGSEVPWVPKLAIAPILGGPVNRRPPTKAAARPGKTPKTGRQKGRKGKSESTVVTGPWGERGTGTASTGAEPTTRIASSGVVSAADVDRVLDKVAASGMASLTEDERAILESASKSLRDRSSE